MHPKSFRSALIAGLLIVSAHAGLAFGEAPASCFADCADGLTGADDRGPARGSAATDVSLHPLDSSGALHTLASRWVERPVIVVFGSFT